MRRPARTLGATVLLCGLGWSAFAWVPSQGGGGGDGGLVQLVLDTPVNFSPTQSADAATSFEADVRALPAVQSTAFFYGQMADNRILAFVMLKPASERQQATDEVYQQVYALLPKYAQLTPHAFGGGALSWTLRGNAWDGLQAQARAMQASLQARPEFAGVTTEQIVGPQRVVLQPNRVALADAHVAMEEVTSTVNMLYSGADAGWFDLDGHHADIRVRLQASARANLHGLSAVGVRAASDRLLPLASLVDLRTDFAPLALTRRDRQRAIDLSARLAPQASVDDARAAVLAAAGRLPEGVQLAWEGDTRAQEENHQQLYFAMALGVVFAYLVLAAQLNSLSLPVLVLTSIPMAAAGAGVALWARGLSLGEMTLMGLLLLFGLVKKNAIMLVDCAEMLRATGMSHFESACQAAQTRLRPILMTTCATAVAVLPAAFALGPGGEQRLGMAWVVLGGLLSSTLLSLVAVPCVLGLRGRGR